MGAKVVRTPAGQNLVIADLMSADGVVVPLPFAVLLPAHDVDEQVRVISVARALLAKGCSQFCFFGPASEALHDELDWILEDCGCLDVITTGDVDPAEACTYFVHAVGSQGISLLAFTTAHVDIERLLMSV